MTREAIAHWIQQVDDELEYAPDGETTPRQRFVIPRWKGVLYHPPFVTSSVVEFLATLPPDGMVPVCTTAYPTTLCPCGAVEVDWSEA